MNTNASLAVVALLVLLPSSGLAQTRGPSVVKVGVCLDADKLEAAKTAGFDYVEINASKVAALADDAFRALAVRAREIGIPIAAANVFIPAAVKLVGPDVDKTRQETYVATTLDRLRTLGVKVVVLGSGGARRVPDGFPRDEAFSQLVDFCRRIAPLAGRNDVTIAIEPLRHQETNIVNTAREGLALVKAVNRPEIQLLVDYYHLSEESEDAAVLVDAGAHVIHTHIANPKGRVYPLAAEESNYRPFFENLCKIRYAGRLSVEASTPDFAAQAPQALAMLRTALACAADRPGASVR